MSVEVPAVCYAACNGAYLEAQRVGESPALCAPNSSFIEDYSNCTNCLATHSESANITSFTIEFRPFVDYCTNLTVANTNSNASQQLLLSSELAAASTLSSLIAVYNSLTSSSPSPSDTSTNLSQTSKPKQEENHGWIAGAVLGPIILVLIFAIALCWIRRGKGRKQTPPIPRGDDPNLAQEKPQLHGNSLVIPKYELESERSPDIPLELPARELAAVELPGDNPGTASS
ncbi:hypothetical protein EG329_012416 [Mollisiaceae sp. DMI_Dod_QoI]|nr:hypothetical protein EG329_012416 [Helotiales sp. DMI_Dod_QoI]